MTHEMKFREKNVQKLIDLDKMFFLKSPHLDNRFVPIGHRNIRGLNTKSTFLPDI